MCEGKAGIYMPIHRLARPCLSFVLLKMISKILHKAVYIYIRLNIVLVWIQSKMVDVVQQNLA